MKLWRTKRDDDDRPYDLLCRADTTGVFQVETSGYRKTLKEFQPRCFDHIVQLNALYRPGALDSKREEDGKSMVEVFIDRLHNREPVTYPEEVRDVLSKVLDATQGIYLYQEQSMKLARLLAGFTETEADNLRKAIGKKQLSRMAAIKPQFIEGMKRNGYSKHAAETQWSNIEASSRYAWNLSHCLPAGTQITTTRGDVPIEDINPGNDTVISRDGRGLCLRPVSNARCNGIRQTYRIVLEDGVEVCATDNHRFLTKKGYKRVDQMERGDTLQVGYDFSPAPHIQILAARVMGPTQGHEVPGWIILYHTKRYDVVDWQLAIVDSTDPTNPAVALSNCVFRSTAPWIDGVTAPGGAGGIEGMVETWASILHGHEREAFFLGSKVGAQEVLDGRRVEAQATRDFRARKLLFKIEAAGLSSHRWSEPTNLTVVGRTPTIAQEAQECLRRAFGEPQDMTYLRVAPALGVQVQDLLPSLFQVLSRYWHRNRPDVDDIPIVPQHRLIHKIEPGPKTLVYDLEVLGSHSFLADGIVSHNSVFYGTITWWTAFFKAIRHVLVPELGLDGPGTAGFYAALINSLDEDKERQADAVAEARQHVEIKPPDINIADESYTVEGNAVVFGLNGIKGMGEANRLAIIIERLLGGPFKNFEDFHRRLPSVPINMKLSLIQCGAFDSTDGREKLLAVVPRQGPSGDLLDKEGNLKTWTVAEFIKHNSTLKKPRELPDITSWRFPSENELAEGEMDSIGFYVSADPMADVNRTLKRLDPSSHQGGEIVKGTIRTKADKNGNEMAWFTLLTNSLNKQRCMVFASNWTQCKPLCVPGKRVIVRGHIDGSQLIVDALFEPGRFDHFKVIQMRRNGEKKVENFDGLLSTVELAEASGYEVMLI